MLFDITSCHNDISDLEGLVISDKHVFMVNGRWIGHLTVICGSNFCIITSRIPGNTFKKWRANSHFCLKWTIIKQKKCFFLLWVKQHLKETRVIEWHLWRFGACVCLYFLRPNETLQPQSRACQQRLSESRSPLLFSFVSVCLIHSKPCWCTEIQLSSQTNLFLCSTPTI